MHNYIKLSRPLKFKKNIIVTWSIASVCNYKCTYCMSYVNDGFYKFPQSYDNMLNFLKLIQEKHPDKTIHLCVLGGEPTLWSLLPSFIKECAKININIHIDTNGSKKSEWWRENAELFTSIDIAYHSEFSNKVHMEDVVKTITKLNIKDNLTLLLLMHPDCFYDNYEFGKYLISKYDNLSIIFKPVRISLEIDKLFDYTDDQNKIMTTYLHSTNRIETKSWNSKELIAEYEDGSIKEKYRNIIMLKKENYWKGWHCNAGIESFQIDFDQCIYTCSKHMGGAIAHLDDNDIILPDKPVTCDVEFCFCAQDISNTKRRI